MVSAAKHETRGFAASSAAGEPHSLRDLWMAGGRRVIFPWNASLTA